ncbi:YggS family pyridoxal phosphate-dependent enzyme [Pantoea sp. Mhis]|uniref:YggS family pyridoxal phosphate-dependent enzyme n=1 Tax=Pantoea sp. Mhis TaxID=2576759 RepID=UPI00135938E7|nr:YggS family pyridoxal phosphate-dependent enzyme [Pantoea sp. Mhis]MXP56691.1 YggS family pyridoxal phosphate-dependent enzyme [Pantoea sp. Mhis]
MISIKYNLQQIRKRILSAAEECGRSPEEITLLAVSKTKASSMILEAILSGQRIFGENYVQEGLKKISELALYSDVQWHFIGSVQSNKSRLVAENFSWCHAIDRLSVAQNLNNHRPDYIAPLNVLIQINISNEQSKSGINLSDLPILAKHISRMSRLQLRGLTAIPAPCKDYRYQLSMFQKVALAFYTLKQIYPNIDTLSLGMSNDLEPAIIAGSTLVRIGTAIFGKR